MSHEGLYDFRFPDIGEGLTEGTVVEVKVAVGQSVTPGQALAIVETDKVVTEMPSPVGGTLVELPITKGQVVKVGEVVARIRTGGASAVGAAAGAAAHAALLDPVETSSVVGRLDSGPAGLLPPSGEKRVSIAPMRAAPSVARDAAPRPAATPPAPQRAAPQQAATQLAAPTNGTKVRASPVARRAAALAGIDISHVHGTGPGGRVLRRDLESTAERAPGALAHDAPVPGAAAHDPQPRAATADAHALSPLRLAIAQAMEKSQAIPAAAVHDFTLVEDLLRLRRDMNTALPKKVGLLAFFVKAAAIALREYPLLSSTYAPDRHEYRTWAEPHIGIAVDTEEGLVVPVIRDAATRGLGGIQEEIARLTEKAKSRTLRLEEIRGGSFTISNFGSFSGVYGNPMILPPQVGILGIGRVHEAPVVKDGAVVPGTILPLSLVVDHRLIDGVYACKFLSRFMELVNKPLLLVMP